MYTYEHPRPALAVDIVVFTLKNWEPHVLLIERGEEPFRGSWALPGGFVRPDETVEAAANRELAEETGVTGSNPIQCAIFSKPGRDPRGWVVSVAYFAFVRFEDIALSAGSDAAKARWFLVNEPPSMAFDHLEILWKSAGDAANFAQNNPILARMLPREFTLSDFQRVSEIISGERLDKRNFRRMVEERGWLMPVGRKTTGPHRPAELYTLAPSAIRT